MTPEEEATYPYRTRVTRTNDTTTRTKIFADLDEAMTYLRDMVLDESAADDDIDVVYSITTYIK